jgi:hypothetical protein
MLLTLLAALPALAGWTPNGAENGCTFYLGSEEAGVQPVRAVCDWPHAPERVHKVVANTALHDEVFSTIDASEPLGPAPGGGSLFRQVHVATGMSDRGATVLYTQTAVAGGTRYAWKLATTQISTSLVPCKLDTGFWEITQGPNGGTHVVYELRYDPGGSVPGFLVRWFQGPGTKTLVGELKRWVEAHRE